MTIKRRASPKRQAPGSHGSSPRILSSEEKRELILAHAAARRPADPLQRMTIAVGVAVCVLFVAGAWLYTVNSGIRRTFASPPDPNLKAAMDSVKQIGSGTADVRQELSAQVQEISDTLDALSQQQAVIELMANQLNATTTSSTQR